MTTPSRSWPALAAIALLAALAVLLTPAIAPAATISSGSLSWTSVNVYRTTAPANTERTWLGFTTNSTDMGAGPPVNGSMAPSAGATGDTVTTASPRGLGAANTVAYPVVTGGYDPATGNGEIELTGVVTFDAPGNGQIYTVEDPLLVLNGASGALYASGRTGNAGAVAYGRGAPIFNLDLSAAVVTDGPGTRTIAGIVPSIAAQSLVFPSNYATGAGPNRTPNTFGSFSLTLRDTTGPSFSLKCPPGIVRFGSAQVAAIGAASDDWSGVSTSTSDLPAVDTSRAGRGLTKSLTVRDQAGNATTQSCTYNVARPRGAAALGAVKRGAAPQVTLALEGAADARVILTARVRKGSRDAIVRVGEATRRFAAAGTQGVNVTLTPWGREALRRNARLAVSWTLTASSQSGFSTTRGTMTLTGSSATR